VFQAVALTVLTVVSSVAAESPPAGNRYSEGRTTNVKSGDR